MNKSPNTSNEWIATIDRRLATINMQNKPNFTHNAPTKHANGVDFTTNFLHKNHQLFLRIHKKARTFLHFSQLLDPNILKSKYIKGLQKFSSHNTLHNSTEELIRQGGFTPVRVAGVTKKGKTNPIPPIHTFIQNKANFESIASSPNEPRKYAKQTQFDTK
jgi:hypothetical protein